MPRFFGKGCTISKGATEIGRVEKIDESKSVGEIEITHIASEAHEYTPGLPELGEVTFTVQLGDEADHEALEAAVDTPEVEEWTLATGTRTKSFYGFCKDWKTSGIEVDGVVKADITVKRTPQPEESEED